MQEIPAISSPESKEPAPKTPRTEIRRALPVEHDGESASLAPEKDLKARMTSTPHSKRDFAEWQIQLERHHFSSGTIDGVFGMRSRRAMYQYQRHKGLPVTQELDFETRLHLGRPEHPFMEYVVSASDLAKVKPTPALWGEKAKQDYLGYNSGWEMVAEKFHSTKAFMRMLNPGVSEIAEGTRLTAPDLGPSLPFPKAARLEIHLSRTTLLAYASSGRVIACFPCSIARDKNNVPDGALTVANIAPNPNYTFDPELFQTVKAREGISTKMILPPGPNNPVGLAWIGLSKPGYGIHGTPDPEAISRTGSSGCFRLANWNALKLLHMVEVGVPVKVVK